ncbi:hypothetical protein GOP47_0007503 [Adiantum capillus-veneris]|uniref:Secreted protein n=1 Tax=Adiantum capillus-veneris TaxID=13818 RepID=A0A9D4ZJD1_ADICA|nr:hypothetical protein GOP47_0007503 [Adiantum capillus-veneris]
MSPGCLASYRLACVVFLAIATSLLSAVSAQVLLKVVEQRSFIMACRKIKHWMGTFSRSFSSRRAFFQFEACRGSSGQNYLQDVTRISSSETGVQPPSEEPTENESDNAATTLLSFRLPLLTPKSLLSKFGSSEKMEASVSPPTTKRQSSGGRSKRFSAAFSFLTSPKRAALCPFGPLGIAIQHAT